MQCGKFVCIICNKINHSLLLNRFAFFSETNNGLKFVLRSQTIIHELIYIYMIIGRGMSRSEGDHAYIFVFSIIAFSQVVTVWEDSPHPIDISRGHC